MLSRVICERCTFFCRRLRYIAGAAKPFEGVDDRWGCLTTIRFTSDVDETRMVTLSKGSDVPEGCLYRVEQVMSGQKNR